MKNTMKWTTSSIFVLIQSGLNALNENMIIIPQDRVIIEEYPGDNSDIAPIPSLPSIPDDIFNAPNP
ncbi:MAG: hypothetical protein LBB11_00355 [Puniceicoccales bacterium]|jgi:hypothetical protein|nr:hypothetical protein [Puniceicoccales bacterium]